MSDIDPEDEFEESLFQLAVDALLWPLRVLTSPLLLRTYLRTALVLIASTILFGAAVVAYSAFYYAYIPVRGVEVPIYLQFDHAGFLDGGSGAGDAGAGFGAGLGSVVTAGQTKWPYGISSVKGLVSGQKYDVEVQLRVPRSKGNVEAGNWMVGVELRGASPEGDEKRLSEWNAYDQEPVIHDLPTSTSTGQTTAERLAASAKSLLSDPAPNILARTARPALLTHRTTLHDLIHRTLRLPLYLTHLATESELLRIPVFSGIAFPRGSTAAAPTVPRAVRVEIRARRPVDVYAVTVGFHARFEGARWVMYRFRVLSAVVGVLGFWGVEMGVLFITWGVFALVFGARGAVDGQADADTGGKEGPETGRAVGRGKVKKEALDDLSDTPRTFPTLPSHAPLHYSSSSSSSAVKREPRDPDEETAALLRGPVKGEEADDEDDDVLLGGDMGGAGLVGAGAGFVGRGDAFTDSGIGTGIESERSGPGLARRRSGRGR